MVTSTTPFFASAVPSYQGVEPVPVTSAPPCTQTITGRASSDCFAALQTLRKRQFSSRSIGPPP